jgi:Na+/H+ antiporter NhaD/arsenite permease-like protein
VLLAALLPLNIRPIPYLIALALGSNVVSALTVVGNPQNMLIGLWSGIGFAGFSIRMLPVVAGGLALTCILLLRLFGNDLSGSFPVGGPRPTPVQLERRLVLAALVIFGVAFAFWLAGGSLPKVAIAAGAVMLPSRDAILDPPSRKWSGSCCSFSVRCSW